MKLSDLIERLGGTHVHGSPDHRLSGVTSPARATSADIVFAEDSAGAEKALAGKAGVVVLRPVLVPSYPPGKCVGENPQPRLWFDRAPPLPKPAVPVGGIHPSSVIGTPVPPAEDVPPGP